MSLVYLAGYNGSRAGAAAAWFAGRLAGATGADLVAVNAYVVAPPVIVPVPDVRFAGDVHSAALQVLDELHVPQISERVASPGSAAAVLLRLAQERQASLIAVGATHRGPLGRLVPGSVGEQLLHGAPCSVAVVPSDWQDRPVATIGVAYDDSPEARNALREAGELALRLGAKLVLIAVAEPMPVNGDWPAAAAEDWEVAGELRHAWEGDINAVAVALGGAIATETRLLDGPAGHLLVDACADGIDVVFAGSRGYGPLHSVLAGSVSRYLVDHAPCPVIVVPRGATAELERPPAGASAAL